MVFGLSAARLNEMGRRPGADDYGFQITATDLGRQSMPPMHIEGPRLEDQSAAVHDGFWQ